MLVFRVGCLTHANLVIDYQPPPTWFGSWDMLYPGVKEDLHFTSVAPHFLYIYCKTQ